MSKVYVHLIIKSNDKHYETLMDNNLSFEDNINLLKDICDINLNEKYYLIYDNYVLKKDIPIKEFYLPQFIRLNVFDVKI